ncbi:MAG: amidohydrolase family protein [Desulfamplus sp.]|nr:amidohydrolase family protein [Desulfamplus sp.]
MLKIHRAGHLLINPWQIIENGFISVENGIIVDISAGNSCNRLRSNISLNNSNHNIASYSSAASDTRTEVIDYGPGILMPALANAHTHFELSALKGKIPFNMGFNGWVRELIKQREECSVDTLRLEAEKAIKTAVATGTSLVGEISTLGITQDIFADSDIGGVWFQEYLGSFGENFKNISGKDISSIQRKKRSIAGHAPHTTSPELLRLLKQQTKRANLPFSIHVAESNDETEFITTGQGRWADFLKERGIDFSLWKSSSNNLNQLNKNFYSKFALSRSPVQYLQDMGLLDNSTLAVHLLNVDSQDIEIIAKTQAKPVLCPKSNFNLHQKLPDIPLFLKYGLKPALGTDSLASTESINMFDEMLYVAEKFPNINPSEILAMATVNSAEALSFGKIAGTIEKGKRADFIYIPLNFSLNTSENNISEIIMRIVEYKSTK